jgi:hypothetical protein
MFTEPIFKNIDATDNFENKISSGQIKNENLERFTLSISENSLNYIGTWHFDNGLVSFSNDKTEFDILLKNKYKKLDFSTALTLIPK